MSLSSEVAVKFHERNPSKLMKSAGIFFNAQDTCKERIHLKKTSFRLNAINWNV